MKALTRCGSNPALRKKAGLDRGPLSFYLLRHGYCLYIIRTFRTESIAILERLWAISVERQAVNFR